MSAILTMLAINALVLAAMFFVLWRIAVRLEDVTFVDSVWAMGMLAMAVTSFVQTGGDPKRKLLLVLVCGLWAVRLGTYLFWRWRHHGPDRRYKTMYAKAHAAKGWSYATWSGLTVFVLQGPLLLIVCLPVQLGQVDAAPPLGALGLAGAAMALVGIAFETIGDWQLARFRGDPANAGQVMDRGLWRYTRHPNYFGDVLTWWGLFLIAAETPVGLWSLPGPLLLTYLLAKWSGVPTVEGRMKRKKPGYEDYVRRTSAFVPWFPKG